MTAAGRPRLSDKLLTRLHGSFGKLTNFEKMLPVPRRESLSASQPNLNAAQSVPLVGKRFEYPRPLNHLHLLVKHSRPHVSFAGSGGDVEHSTFYTTPTSSTEPPTLTKVSALSIGVAQW